MGPEPLPFSPSVNRRECVVPLSVPKWEMLGSFWDALLGPTGRVVRGWHVSCHMFRCGRCPNQRERLGTSELYFFPVLRISFSGR